MEIYVVSKNSVIQNVFQKASHPTRPGVTSTPPLSSPASARENNSPRESNSQRDPLTVTAGDIMHRDFISAGPKTSVTELLRLFHSHRMRAIPIVNADDELLGIVTDADLFFKKRGLPHSREKAPCLFGEFVNFRDLGSRADLGATWARDVMSDRVVTIEEDLTTPEIALLMCDRHHHTVPVMRGRKVVGVARRYDVLAQIFGIEEASPIAAVAS
jgi:CBS-domain-containing membrane protein